MDLPTDDSVWRHKRIVTKRSADLLFCWHGHYHLWNWLSPRKYCRPSQKETSFTTPIFQGAISSCNPHPKTRRLFEEIDGLEPGTWHHLCLGMSRCCFQLFFFLGGGGEKTAMEKFIQIYTQCFLNGVIRDSGFCGLISLTTKNGRSFDFWWIFSAIFWWKGGASFCMVFTKHKHQNPTLHSNVFFACFCPILSKTLSSFPTTFLSNSVHNRPDRFSLDPYPLSKNSVRVRSRAKDQSWNWYCWDPLWGGAAACKS